MSFTFILVYLCLAAIGFAYGQVEGSRELAVALAAFALLPSFGVAKLLALLLGGTGSTTSQMIFGNHSPEFNIREILAGDLRQIKQSIKEHEYETASRKVNQVLQQEEDFPEALFLKGQILWEGFFFHEVIFLIVVPDADSNLVVRNSCTVRIVVNAPAYF